eukprot:1160760-Pelagomonas_calceolata.AAC.8
MRKRGLAVGGSGAASKWGSVWIVGAAMGLGVTLALYQVLARGIEIWGRMGAWRVRGLQGSQLVGPQARSAHQTPPVSTDTERET